MNLPLAFLKMCRRVGGHSKLADLSSDLSGRGLLIKALEDDHKSVKDVSRALKQHVKDSGYRQNPEVMTSFVVSDGDVLFS